MKTIGNGQIGTPWPRHTSERMLVGIPVAAHQESWDTVIRTLALLLTQEGNQRNYRVFLLLNSPDDEFSSPHFDRIRRAVVRFQERNPRFNLSVAQCSFPDDTPIGTIRGHLWDCIADWVTHNRRTPLPYNIYGLSTDIDAQYMSKQLLQLHTEALDRLPEAFASYGYLFWGKTYPEIHSLPVQPVANVPSGYSLHTGDYDEQIVNQYISFLNAAENIRVRYHKNRHMIYEANTAFRLRSYMEVGRIDPSLRKGEVLDLIERLEHSAPLNGDKKITWGYTRSAYIASHPRRHISAVARGIPITATWDLDKHEFTQRDRLREEAPYKHLVRGAALKIVAGVEQIACDEFAIRILEQLNDDERYRDEIATHARAAIEDFVVEVEAIYNRWIGIGASDSGLRTHLPCVLDEWFANVSDSTFETRRRLMDEPMTFRANVDTRLGVHRSVPPMERCFAYELAGAR